MSTFTLPRPEILLLVATRLEGFQEDEDTGLVRDSRGRADHADSLSYTVSLRCTLVTGESCIVLDCLCWTVTVVEFTCGPGPGELLMLALDGQMLICEGSFAWD